MEPIGGGIGFGGQGGVSRSWGGSRLDSGVITDLSWQRCSC